MPNRSTFEIATGILLGALLAGCSGDSSAPQPAPTPAPLDYTCQLVEEGFGPQGDVAIGVDVVVSGFEIPWAIGFLPDGSWMVTERGGDVRRVDPQGTLDPEPVITVPAARAGEGGLLGLAIHPEFAENKFFYLFYTGTDDGELNNRIERYILSDDGTQASLDRTILEGMPANRYHDGGRLRFGPDGMLYATMGDAGIPDLAPDPASLAGKVLRIDPDGGIPEDNPYPESAAWLIGVRNSQGIDWREDGRMVLVDHGPSFEFGLRGLDEINIADAGENLGWPAITGCETEPGLAPPSMSWKEAMPPGGLAIYTGDEIPQWRGDALIGVLGFGGAAGHLHRIRLDPAGNVTLSEVYLLREYGRLRDVIMGPDGGLYVTTSNCDGRGDCPESKDVILRIGRP